MPAHLGAVPVPSSGVRKSTGGNYPLCGTPKGHQTDRGDRFGKGNHMLHGQTPQKFWDAPHLAA